MEKTVDWYADTLTEIVRSHGKSGLASAYVGLMKGVFESNQAGLTSDSELVADMTKGLEALKRVNNDMSIPWEIEPDRRMDDETSINSRGC